MRAVRKGSPEPSQEEVCLQHRRSAAALLAWGRFLPQEHPEQSAAEKPIGWLPGRKWRRQALQQSLDVIDQEQTNTRGQEHFPHCCPSGSASESGSEADREKLFSRATPLATARSSQSSAISAM